jgi:hypothetical protein
LDRVAVQSEKEGFGRRAPEGRINFLGVSAPLWLTCLSLAAFGSGCAPAQAPVAFATGGGERLSVDPRRPRTPIDGYGVRILRAGR